MTEEQEDKKAKKAPKKHTALKILFTSNGKVNKGEEFTCSSKEFEIFKKAKAV